MADRIALRGLCGFGRHGVHPTERTSGQAFVVDVVLTFDDVTLANAALTDEVADTVHYGELADRVLKIVEGEPVNLIETLAARIAEECLVDARVQAVEVTVHKPEAPVGVPVDDVAVTICRDRT